MSYIQNKVKYDKTSYKSERDVMQFLCCVLEGEQVIVHWWW